MEESVKKKIIEKDNEIIIEVTAENPADKRPTGTRITQSKECIILQKL